MGEVCEEAGVFMRISETETFVLDVERLSYFSFFASAVPSTLLSSKVT